MKDLIKKYLNETISTKRGMKKRIYQLEKNIEDAKVNEQYAIDQMNKYKTKYLKEHNKYKELEKESNEIIEELTNELKKKNNEV